MTTAKVVYTSMGNRKIVFFVDVDNTLLDNDQIKDEIKKSLISVLGEEEATHFWEHHDSFRSEKKLVDFPNIIREYCNEFHKVTCEIKLNSIFNSINFTHALYPKVKEVLAYLKSLGKVVIFSEGDFAYQRAKIDKSGLSNLVDEVLLYKHKLEHLLEIERENENAVLVFLDDKAKTLSDIKKQLPNSFLIEVCQGHYAKEDHKEHKGFDKTVYTIDELLKLTRNEIFKMPLEKEGKM